MVTEGPTEELPRSGAVSPVTGAVVRMLWRGIIVMVRIDAGKEGVQQTLRGDDALARVPHDRLKYETLCFVT